MKKALNVIKTVLVWLVVILAVAMMIFTVISVTTFNKNDRNLFGYKMYIVNSDSMKATDFDAGSLIFVKNVDPSTPEGRGYHLLYVPGCKQLRRDHHPQDP